jgi:hypothetical protein
VSAATTGDGIALVLAVADQAFAAIRKRLASLLDHIYRLTADKRGDHR